MAHDVFISYSSQDKAIADAACATLEGHKIRCWIAPRDVLPGSDYSESLTTALERCRVLVLVFSASSNRSPHVRREVEIAFGKGAIVIPFRIEDVSFSSSLKYFLSTIHWLDALTPPLEQHLKTLAETVERLLPGRGDEATARGRESPSLAEQGHPAVVPHPVSTPTPSSGATDTGDTGERPAPRRPRRRKTQALAWVAAALTGVLILGMVWYVIDPWRDDPCGPRGLPPSFEPAGPLTSPPADKDRPLLPSDPKKWLCSVTVRNETGKRLRMWRYFERPKGDRTSARWRVTPLCGASIPIPQAEAGWAYVVIEDLADNVGQTGKLTYYPAGWKYLPYGSILIIRVRAGFFEDPESERNYQITELSTPRASRLESDRSRAESSLLPARSTRAALAQSDESGRRSSAQRLSRKKLAREWLIPDG